jgi:hypothetical protein
VGRGRYEFASFIPRATAKSIEIAHSTVHGTGMLGCERDSSCLCGTFFSRRLQRLKPQVFVLAFGNYGRHALVDFDFLFSHGGCPVRGSLRSYQFSLTDLRRIHYFAIRLISQVAKYIAGSSQYDLRGTLGPNPARNPVASGFGRNVCQRAVRALLSQCPNHY